MTTPGATRANVDARQRRTSSRLMVVPLLAFAGLAGVLVFALKSGDPSKLPSALIGKPAPSVTFAPLEGFIVGGTAMVGFGAAQLADGIPTIVNFWASWCPPCVAEHPMLMRLALEPGTKLFGVNYKDQPANARRFLGRHGNPFRAVGVDPTGRGAIEWGVYGMPETFVLDGRGRIVLKHVGAITEAVLAARILPAIAKARTAGGGGK